MGGHQPKKLLLNKGSEVKVTQSCLTLCDPHGLYSPWNSLGQNTRASLVAQSVKNLPAVQEAQV